MSQEVERVYTVNLGKVLLSPDNQRAAPHEDRTGQN